MCVCVAYINYVCVCYVCYVYVLDVLAHAQFIIHKSGFYDDSVCCATVCLLLY